MRRPMERNVLHALLVLYAATLARSALLEMSRMLWNKTVSGGLTKVGRLDPLRVPVIKVDQSEGDTSYRIILRNLEIVGLNDSTLESIYIARGALKSNLSELEAGYVSYSDLRDVDSVKYRFHTMLREPSVPRESFEAVVSPVNRAADIRPSSRYQEGRFDRLQQDQYGSRIFEHNQQYDRQIPFRPEATSDGFYRSNLRASSIDDEAGNFGKRPAYVQSAYAQRARDFRGHQRSSYDGDVDCEGTADSQFTGNPKNSRQYEQRQNSDGRRGEDVEVRLEF